MERSIKRENQNEAEREKEKSDGEINKEREMRERKKGLRQWEKRKYHNADDTFDNHHLNRGYPIQHLTNIIDDAVSHRQGGATGCPATPWPPLRLL